MKIKAEVDQAKLAVRLGLPEDADEAAIEAALDAEAGSAPSTTATTEPSKLPEGVVAIDAAKLAELEQGAQAGATVAASLAKNERDETITGAIKGGRIAAGSRSQWETRWDANADEARKLLTAKVEDGGLAAVIPVERIEAGRAGDGEGDPAAEDQVMAAIYDRHFPELKREVA